MNASSMLNTCKSNENLYFRGERVSIYRIFPFSFEQKFLFRNQIQNIIKVYFLSVPLKDKSVKD